MMNSLHLYENYIDIIGFETIKDKIYFHFLPTMKFSIMEKPSVSDIAIDIGYKITDGKIKDIPLLTFLKDLGKTEIQFIFVGGIYLPVNVENIPEDSFINYAKKINFSADIL